MLGKLFKHEMRATTRMYLPLFGLLAVLTALNKLMGMLNSSNGASVYGGIIMLAYVLSVIAIPVAVVLFTVQRFYKNLLCDEGYLMFTLPVRSEQLILSKLFSALIWCATSGLFAAVSILVTVMSKANWQALPGMLRDLAEVMRTQLDINFWVFAFEFVLAAILSLCVWVLIVYCSMALGQQFSKNKLLASFGMYIALNVGLQIVMTAGLSLLVKLQSDYSIFDPILDGMSALAMMHSTMGAGIVLALICAVGFFFATNALLKKRLNLE